MMEDLDKLKPALCLLPYLCEFSAYLQLMKNLIRGSEDVKLLTKCSVIVKFLGNETDVCPAWNSLTRGLQFQCQSRSIHQIAQGINGHCNSRNCQKTQFCQKFCSRPWYVISIFVATIVTIDTCILAHAAIIGSDRVKPHFPPRWKIDVCPCSSPLIFYGFCIIYISLLVN